MGVARFITIMGVARSIIPIAMISIGALHLGTNGQIGQMDIGRQNIIM